MTVTFALVGYTSADMTEMLDSLVPMFTIEPDTLNYGTFGIACALNECVNAGTVVGWPDNLDPLGANYKDLYENCKALLDWQTECSPGSFSNARFWVRVDFE